MTFNNNTGTIYATSYLSLIHISICRSHFKNAKIAASEYAAKIFAKPSAKTVMREMDQNAALVNGFTEPYEDKLDELSADVILHEGDVVDLGSLKFKVLNAAEMCIRDR